MQNAGKNNSSEPLNMQNAGKSNGFETLALQNTTKKQVLSHLQYNMLVERFDALELAS